MQYILSKKKKFRHGRKFFYTKLQNEDGKLETI